MIYIYYNFVIFIQWFFSNLNIENMMKVVAELFLFRYLRNDELKSF